jgi:hypothetical protein
VSRASTAVCSAPSKWSGKHLYPRYPNRTSLLLCPEHVFLWQRFLTMKSLRAEMSFMAQEVTARTERDSKRDSCTWAGGPNAAPTMHPYFSPRGGLEYGTQRHVSPTLVGVGVEELRLLNTIRCTCSATYKTYSMVYRRNSPQIAGSSPTSRVSPEAHAHSLSYRPSVNIYSRTHTPYQCSPSTEKRSLLDPFDWSGCD